MSLSALKVSIGADHGGYLLRRALKEALHSWGVSIIDHGTDGPESVDYPDFGIAVAKDVASGNADFGVAVCTSGIGISISANKVKGARAALIHNEDAAEFSRRHNDANIICFGGKYDTPYLATKYLKIFLETEFEGGRHERRVDMIKAEENNFPANP